MEEQIRKQILELTEDLTAEVVEKVFKFIDFYIEYTPNKYDDVLLPFLNQAKDFVLKYVDKIDGEEDAK